MLSFSFLAVFADFWDAGEPSEFESDSSRFETSGISSSIAKEVSLRAVSFSSSKVWSRRFRWSAKPKLSAMATAEL
jgi:hypothetical protein